MDEKKKTLSGMWNIYRKGGLTPAIASMFGVQSAQQMAYIRSMIKEQRKQGLYEIYLEQMPVVVFDLETTGFSPYQGDEIISIGAVVVTGGQIQNEECFYSVVNPRREVPPEIEKLTGITNEMTADAPELIDVLHRFFEFIDQRVLLAHGTGHDKHFLNAALWKTSRVNFAHRLLDSMVISKWLFPFEESYALDDVLLFHNIPITQRHHAFEDAMMTAELWKLLLKNIMERNILTLGDLYSKLSHR